MKANQKPIKEVLKSLMTAMSHYDPDFVEMAAQDLCKHILKGDIDLKDPANKDMAKAITEDYLKQVGSMSFEVHSTAIRCLAEIVPKLSNDELVHIFKSTISSIVDPKTESKRMQVFCSSASTMINLAPGNLGHQLSTLFVECVTEFLKLSTRKCSRQDEEVILHLLSLIIDFTGKWPDTVGNKDVKYDRLLLIEILLKNVQTSRKIDLIKKSDMALEKLATVFDRTNFEFAFDHKEFGILKFVTNLKTACDEDTLKKLKNGISCINHISHAHNAEMKPWAKQIAFLCVELVENHRGNENYVFEVTEIVENSIDCLTALLKAYASELKEWVGTGNFYLCSFLEETLNFDLEGMMTTLDAGNQYEDQYGEEENYFSEGSFCWKVREVSLSYVTMLMKKDPEFREHKGKSIEFLNLLSNKLIEQNQNVSKKAFECFNYIIESISTTKHKHEQNDLEQEFVLKRVKSNEGNFALTLVDNISSRILILFNHKKTKDESKTEAAKTLLNLIQLLNEIIKDNETICVKTLKLLEELFSKVKPESCVFLIKSSKTLINGTLPFNKVENILKSYLSLAKSNNFKISAASFDGLRNVLKYYHNDLLKTGKIDEILNILLPKLKEHDIDKTVKSQAIRCLGPIFRNIISKLPEKISNQLLISAEIKLKVEIDKTTILSQIPQIPAEYNISKSQEAIFLSMLTICSESIGTANYELSSLSVQCCDKLIRLQIHLISEKNVNQILNKCRPLLMESKIPKFMDIIIEKFPKPIEPFSEAIVKTADAVFIEKLINKKIISPQNCINILKQVANSDNSRKLSYIVSRVFPSKEKLLSEINESRWGIINLGALGYVGDLQTIEVIKKIIVSNQNHDLKFEGARSIGNIVSRYPQFVTQVLQLSKNSQQGYLYLQSLKQMLSFSKSEFPKMPVVIQFILKKSQQKDRQTNKHLLAQCLGNIIKISANQTHKILDSLSHMNSDCRYIVASALRYTLEAINSRNGQAILDQSFDRFVVLVLGLVRDNDLFVREGALKSLNSIFDHHEEVIRREIQKDFILALLDSMTIKDELIKIIDYGVSKEKKDFGKGLRIEAFNFIKSIINFRQVENYYDDIIRKCLEKITVESSSDLILKRISIIRLIGQKDFTIIMPYQNDLASMLGITEGVLKPYTSPNYADDERSEGYLKILLKEIYKISKLSKEGTDSIKGMINKIKINERLNKLLVVIETEE